MASLSPSRYELLAGRYGRIADSPPSPARVKMYVYFDAIGGGGGGQGGKQSKDDEVVVIKKIPILLKMLID